MIYMKQKFGAGIWHFATYVDRYNTEGYGEPKSVLDAIQLAGKVKDLSVVDINFPYFGGSFSNQQIKNELHEVESKLTEWQKKKKSEADKLRKELNKKAGKTKRKTRR